MGQIAAQTVVDLIEGRSEYVPEIPIEPELVVRKSTGPASSRHQKKIKKEARVRIQRVVQPGVPIPD
jgi:hypothetical protein